MKKANGGSAEPVMGLLKDGFDARTYHDFIIAHSGKSLRDYFAATVAVPELLSDVTLSTMQTVLNRPAPADALERIHYYAEYYAFIRGMLADAMLRERDQPIKGLADDL